MLPIWIVINLCLTASSAIEALFWQEYWAAFVLGLLAVCSWIAMLYVVTRPGQNESPYMQTVFPAQGSDSRSWF